MKNRTTFKAIVFISLFATGVMAATISRVTNFSDGDILTAAQLNAEFNNVVDGVNSINNDNIVVGAAISPSKISAAIKGSGIARNSSTGALSVNPDNVGIEIVSDAVSIKNLGVTTARIADEAVTSAKIAANAVTRAETAVIDQIPAGSVMQFHTFNGATAVPRGWMILNGNVVSEANYNAIHGAGTYAADGVASSPLLAKNLPNMVNRYATGVLVTGQNGSAPISAVGVQNNVLNLQHDHDAENQYAHIDTEPSGSFYVEEPTSPPGLSWNADFLITTTSRAASGSLRTNGAVVSGDTDNALSVAQTIRPDSIEFIFIIKVI